MLLGERDGERDLRRARCTRSKRSESASQVTPFQSLRRDSLKIARTLGDVVKKNAEPMKIKTLNVEMISFDLV